MFTKSKLQVHIAWKNENKLKNTLIKSAICKARCPGGSRCHLCMSDFKGDCIQKNVVYKINCKLCKGGGKDVSYVGESMRPVRLRYNEHRRDAINHTPNTPFGEHFLKEHAPISITDTDILQLKILYRAQDHPDRKIAESIFIRTQTPTLNTQGSSWPIMRVMWCHLPTEVYKFVCACCCICWHVIFLQCEAHVVCIRSRYSKYVFVACIRSMYS